MLQHIDGEELLVQELNMENSNTLAARLVRNWSARCSEDFAGVNCRRLISHLAVVHAQGGVNLLAKETGLHRNAVIDLLRTAR